MHTKSSYRTVVAVKTTSMAMSLSRSHCTIDKRPVASPEAILDRQAPSYLRLICESGPTVFEARGSISLLFGPPMPMALLSARNHGSLQSTSLIFPSRKDNGIPE